MLKIGLEIHHTFGKEKKTKCKLLTDFPLIHKRGSLTKFN